MTNTESSKISYVHPARTAASETAPAPVSYVHPGRTSARVRKPGSVRLEAGQTVYLTGPRAGQLA